MAATFAIGIMIPGERIKCLLQVSHCVMLPVLLPLGSFIIFWTYTVVNLCDDFDHIGMLWCMQVNVCPIIMLLLHVKATEGQLIARTSYTFYCSSK